MNSHSIDEIAVAAEHLPEDSALVVQQVSWDDYERLLDDLAHRPSLRISYDSGRLEVMSPSRKHALYESLISDLVLIFCDVFRLNLEKFASETWKMRSLKKGVEPDLSFYVQNPGRTAGEDVNSESTNPPDIFVEVDVTRSSLNKFSIFAAFGIPEVWRYDGSVCRFYSLRSGEYIESSLSQFLPGLTGKMVADAIELAKAKGQEEGRRFFRRNMKLLRRRTTPS